MTLAATVGVLPLARRLALKAELVAAEKNNGSEPADKCDCQCPPSHLSMSCPVHNLYPYDDDAEKERGG